MAIRPPRIHPDDPRRPRKDRQKSGVNLMHEDPFYGFNVGRKIPAQGSTDPSGVTFDGLPPTRLKYQGLTKDELGDNEVDARVLKNTGDANAAVGPLHVQTGAAQDRWFPFVEGVGRALPPVKVRRLNYEGGSIDDVAQADNSTTRRVLASDSHDENDPFSTANTNKDPNRAASGSAIPTKAIHGYHAADDAFGLRAMAQSIQGPAQADFGLRKIGNLLGGNSQMASASDHSHGSGNTHDFDYLPDTHQARILLARQRVRQNIRNLDTLTAAQFRLYIRELAIVALSSLALEIDAPDLTAEERRAKRQAGESIPDFFEWRRSAELEAAGEEAPLHTHDLPRYQEGLPDVGTVPE